MKGEFLIVQAEGKTPPPNSLGSFGENGAKALRRAFEGTGGGVKCVSKAGSGGRDRQRCELAGQSDVEQGELGLESAIEVCEWVDPSGSRASLSTTSPFGP